MAEVHKYEFSVLRQERPTHNVGAFTQFCFDNADFNIRTLDGRNTFHCMGGIKCTAPASDSEVHPLPRTREVPNAGVIAAMGKFDISWYRKPSSAGLKDVQIKELNVKISDSVVIASRMNTLWLAGRWSGVTLPPSWKGFMKTSLSALSDSPTTSIEALPFINLEPSNPSTIYSALKFAAKQCSEQGQSTCFVTFDQPLYAKAAEIVTSDTSEDLKNVIVRLGGFHLLMSFLGAIGYVMNGSGLEELWAEIYAKSTVTHMMSGHAYSRSLRAHFLTKQAIGTILLSMANVPNDERDEIQVLFNRFLEHTADDLHSHSCLQHLTESIDELFSSMSQKSRTGKLWIEYLKQVNLVKMFIRAERSGDWQLHLFCVKSMLPLLHASGHIHYAHLYVQQMEDLPNRMSTLEFSKFAVDGFFAIRRTHEFWSGTWSDMVIEQNLTRAMKVKGGLVHGRGLTGSVITQWILSGPGCMKLCDSLEKLSGVYTSSSEQHVELRDSRKSRDDRDVQILIDWLNGRSPFYVLNDLQSISSGIVADKTINCDQAATIGQDILKGIIGGNFGDLKLKRNHKVRSLANMTSTLQVRDDTVAVNPTQLFMRIVCVMRTENDLSSYLKYELAPKPPSLFDDVSLRKTSKSTLAEVFLSGAAASEKFSPDTKVVIDGGYLLHAVVWARPATFGQLCEGYVSFVEKKFSSSANIVFDGYEKMTTKEEEGRRRCSGKTTANVSADYNIVVTSSQTEFLKNSHNKHQFVGLLLDKFRTSGHHAIQCEGDADSSIVAKALEFDDVQDVAVISNDTDVLVMLVARARKGSRISVVHPSTSKTSGKTFKIAEICKMIGEMNHSALFCHAFTGCDTTSAFFMKGKKQAWKILQESESLRDEMKIFVSPNSNKQAIISAGEKFAISLYDSAKSKCTNLDDLRVVKYSQKIAKQPVTASFQLASLPPTSASCEEHSLRVYLQVQEWLGRSLDPSDWGWKIQNASLIPVTTRLPPAPDHLLNLVSCNCKSSCGNRCECVRSGLECSLMCGSCRGAACGNVTYDGCDDEEVD